MSQLEPRQCFILLHNLARAELLRVNMESIMVRTIIYCETANVATELPELRYPTGSVRPPGPSR